MYYDVFKVFAKLMAYGIYYQEPMRVGFNINTLDYQYRDSYDKDKTVLSYFIMEIPYPERRPLHWNGIGAIGRKQAVMG